jgi:uncharacterized protein YukE
MVQLGMDADAVEAAGRQLQAKAQSIDAVVAQVNRSVTSLISVWDGRDAQAFNASWPDIQKSIAAASQAVAGLGQSALNNASEQRQASGSSGTAGIGGGTIGLMHSSSVPSLEDQFFTTLKGGANSSTLGAPWSVSQIGSLLPGGGNVFDAIDIADSLHKGQVPIFSMVDVAGGALRDNPATYLAGAAAGVWNSVGKDLVTAIQAGPPTNDLSYIQSDPLGALNAAVEANVKALPDLIGDVMPGFLK